MTADLYRKEILILQEAKVPFLIGGAWALDHHAGIKRDTKDLDFFVRRKDAQKVLDVYAKKGYRTELTFPHWLGKVFFNDNLIDVIFGSGNGLCLVDDEWFKHSVRSTIQGVEVNLVAAEEMIWSKGFVVERDRFDGHDISHIILAQGPTLDWDRLVRRFGPHWRVLLVHLLLFGFSFPFERARVPAAVLDDLLARARAEDSESVGPRICRGTLLSLNQYHIDVHERGFSDARLKPIGNMSPEEIAHWEGSFPPP